MSGDPATARREPSESPADAAPGPSIPLSLYVHIPWCVRKCPYCDFNSHGLRGALPVAEYIAALLADLDGDLADFASAIKGREITSVFFGGGTPSLFPPAAIAELLSGVQTRIPFARDVEITLEANPGTVEHGRFDGYLRAGVNRISIGVQSFDDAELAALGRIHSAREAAAAVALAQSAGCTNVNLDLMYALPRQTLDGALTDVERAIRLHPQHISHYQLTLEPGTRFAKRPPPLPGHDAAWDMQEACQARLAAAGYGQYEISAYAQTGHRCRHNLNYWRFGDYLGIGAGAHGKLTGLGAGQRRPNPRPSALVVHRRSKVRSPRAYLRRSGARSRIDGTQPVTPDQLPFEFMLNALRLLEGVPLTSFSVRTGLPVAAIGEQLRVARAHGWLRQEPDRLQATRLGQRFLNDLIEVFLAAPTPDRQHA